MNPFHDVTEDRINKMIEVMASLPPLKKQEVINTPTERCVCNKLVPINKLCRLDTGALVTLNDVCRGCKDGAKIDNELARIVCAGCKRVVLRIKPAKDKTGFAFVAGKSYHISNCSLCSNGDGQYPIIEKVLHNRRNGINSEHKL